MDDGESNPHCQFGENHTLSGGYQGKEAVFGFFGKLTERSGGTAHSTSRMPSLTTGRR